MAFIVKREIIAAPTTLPLSTTTFTITNSVLFRQNIGQYTFDSYFNYWVFDNSPNDGNAYIIAYGYFGARWSLRRIDDEGFNYELASNSASSTAIPLNGWSPTVTIVTP